MEWIYLASAIFGGSFLIPMVLGGLSSDMDIDFDTDADVDLGTDVDFDADVDTEIGTDADSGQSPSTLGSGVSAGQAIVGSILSFRSIVFFATFFGVAGLVFGFLGYGSAVTVITALVLGVVAALANSTLWGLLKASEMSSQVGTRSFEGRAATVTVPIDDGRRGRIRLELAGQPHYLVAEAIDGEDPLPAGRSVVVIDIDQGVARVAALPELD